jgi:hypothetical protein
MIGLRVPIIHIILNRYYFSGSVEHHSTLASSIALSHSFSININIDYYISSLPSFASAISPFTFFKISLSILKKSLSESEYF